MISCQTKPGISYLFCTVGGGGDIFMLKNYFVLVLRNLKENKFYTIIKV